MNAIPFDTLKLARDLEAAGLAPPVAAGASAALADALVGADLVTKSDLAAFEGRFDARLNVLDAKFDSRLNALDAKFDSRLNALDAKFDAKLNALDAKFDAKNDSVVAKLELLRRDMTIRLGGMMIVAVSVLLTAMRLMPHP
jgi:hypothetical protein